MDLDHGYSKYGMRSFCRKDQCLWCFRVTQESYASLKTIQQIWNCVKSWKSLCSSQTFSWHCICIRNNTHWQIYPEQPPTVTPTNRVACSWKNLVTYLPVSTNPVATSFVGVSQIAFSTWTDSAVGNWYVPTTSMFFSCWKGKWRSGLSWHRFKSWRDFDSFCVGKCLWAFRITSLKFEFWGEKWYFGSPSIVIGA